MNGQIRVRMRCSRLLPQRAAGPRHIHGILVSRHRQTVECASLPEGSSQDSGQPTALQKKQASLEALLAQEGIELAQSSAPSALGFSTPDVDWSRYHVQILFVDRTDTLRARVAAGIFDKIAAWNGFGRAMLSWSCGLDAQPPAPTLSLLNRWNAPSFSTFSSPSLSPSFSSTASRTAAVLSAASALKLEAREVARPAEQFEVEDLDRYDLVVCLDRGIREAILGRVAPTDREYYEEKVCLLSSFSRYEGDFALLARGGFALLPMQLSFLLRNGRKALSLLKLQEDITSPELAGEQGMTEWNDMVQALICCTAGLAKYLMDAQPDHHWEPQD